jgi:hypothetical protein
MKSSTSQIWLMHSLEVLAVGSIFTGVVTAYSAAQTGGFTLQTGGVLIGSVVVAFLSNGLKGMASNVNTAQALTDSLSELQQSHNNLIGQFSNLLFHLHAVQSPALSQPVQTPPTPPLPLDAQPTQQNQQVPPGLQFTTSVPQPPSSQFVPAPALPPGMVIPPFIRDWTGLLPVTPPPQVPTP